MAKSSTATGATRSASKTGAKSSKPKSSTPRKTAKPAGSRSSAGKSQGGQSNGAADALIKLIESPLVAELLAIGASAALASLAAGRFGRGDDGQGTRRALKAAAKSAATAMGTRLATEVDEIRKASKRAREDAAA